MDDVLTQSLELLRRAQGGDRAALNDLFERYYERVRPIVRVRLSPALRRRVDSGDILQQVFDKAAQIYDRFEVRNEANLIGWLARIAEHQIHDEADKQSAGKRRADLEVALSGGDDEPSIDLPADDPGPGSLSAARDQQRALEDAIAALPLPLRDVVLMRDYQGMSWKQIASETGRPSADAARMAHNTALIKLGERLKRDS